MNGNEFLNSPVAHALGWALLHAVWQGFALVLPAAGVLHLLRSQSSQARYRLGVLTLLTQLLASAATFSWYYKLTGTGTLTTAVLTSTGPALPVRWQAMVQTLPWHEQVQRFLEVHLAEFVLIYLIGVIVFGLRLVGGWVYLQRISQTATHPVNAYSTELTNQLRTALSIRPVVRVRESARIVVPMVVGVLKPILLLPISLATNLSVREVEAVLAHELAHVKRHDYAVNLLQSVVEVLYFFHPALWWLSARVREEREHCCDDLAVQVCGGNGRILAQALARVEELRLAQASTPELAMAFATNRQQLLHRVQRMLGVPTQPFVSNGSLAGLTLATILLMSVSVYAIQKQDEPKHKTTQLKPTRRHKVDRNSEYGMTGTKEVSYVIWKGQKLPASRIARLQKQLDQVMAGQSSLDAVKQPDRDILLTIIEKNNSFDQGMDGLAAGLSKLDYNTIIKTGLDAANEAGTFPVNVDSVLKQVQKIDYNKLIGNAMAGVSPVQPVSDSLKRTAAQHKLDSLMASMNAVMAQRKEAINRITKEMSAIALKNQPIEKQLTPLRNLQTKQAGKLGELASKQASLAYELARISQRNDAKSQTLQRQMEAEQSKLQRQMEQQQRQLEQAMGQLQPLTNQLEPVQQRLAVLADSISQLYEPITAMSVEIGALSQQLAEDAMRQVEDAMRSTENMNLNINVDRAIPPARPRPAPRPPRPAKAPTVRPAPAVPAAPVRPSVRVEPVRPAAPPPVPKAVPTPKPAVAPQPPKP